MVYTVVVVVVVVVVERRRGHGDIWVRGEGVMCWCGLRVGKEYIWVDGMR